MKKGITVVIKFKPDTIWFKETGGEMVLRHITEVHYNYKGLGERTAFESDIEGTGQTIENKYIDEMEIKL